MSRDARPSSAADSPVSVLYVDPDGGDHDPAIGRIENAGQYTVDTVDTVDTADIAGVDCLVVTPAADLDWNHLEATVPVVLYSDVDPETLPPAVVEAADTVVERGNGDRSRRFLAEKVRRLTLASESLEGSLSTALAAVDGPVGGEATYFLLDDDGTVAWSSAPFETVFPVDQDTEGAFEERVASLVASVDGADRYAGRTDGSVAEYLTLPLADGDRQYRLETHTVDGGGADRLAVVTDVTDPVERVQRLDTFRSLVEGTQDGLYTIDETGAIDFCNTSFAAMLGYEPGDLVGRQAWETIAAGELERGQATVERLRTDPDRESTRVDLVFEHRDGHHLEVEVNFTLRHAASGAYDGLVCVARDVTEQRERERELERYRHLVDAMRDAACIYDAEGNFEVVNEALAAFRGTTPEALEGERDQYIDSLRENEPGDPFADLVSGEREELRGEFETTFPDVGPVVVEYRLTRLVIDGEFDGVVGVAREITERKQTEERLESFVNCASDALAIVGETGEFMELSPATADVLGYDPAELEGASVFEHVHPDDRDRVVERFRALVDTDEPATERVEYRFEHGDDSWVWLESVGSTRPDSALDGYVITSRDVTDRKERERDLERHESLVNTADDPMFAIGPDGRLTLVNDRFARLAGLDRETLIGAPPSVLTGQGSVSEHVIDTWQSAYSDLVRCDRSQIQYEVEVEVGETTRVFEGHMTLLDADDGSTVNIFREITERVEREQQLRATQQFNEELVENAPVGLFRLDSDLNLIYENPRAEEILGIPHGETSPVLGTDIREIPSVKQTGEAEMFGRLAEGEAVEFEFPFESLHGTEAYLTGRAVPLYQDGEFDGAIMMANDISELKEREQELRAARQFNEELVENAPVALFRLDDQLCISYENPRAEEIMGVPGDLEESRAIGVDIREIPSVKQTGEAEMFGKLADGEPVEFEFPFESIYGNRAYLTGRAVPLYQDGEFDGAIMMANDISELKEREQEVRAERDKLTRLETVVTSIQPLTEKLTRAATREGLEQAVCTQLAESDAYNSAWLGGYSSTADHVQPRAHAGLSGDYFDGVTLDESDDDMVAAALRTGEVQVASDTESEDTVHGRPDKAALAGYRSAAVIPLTYRSTTYGVLAVHCAEPETLTDRELSVLAGLGQRIGHAISALENRRLLRSDSVVELRFEESPPDHPLSSVAATCGCTLELEDIARTADNDYLFHLAVAGADPDAVCADLEATGEVAFARPLESRAGTALVQCRYTGPNPVAVLVDNGAAVRSAEFTPEGATVVAEVAPKADTRSIAEMLSADCPGFELASKRERDSAGGRLLTADSPELWDRLTSRQREIIEAAYHAGYYDWPRETNAEELAAALDISSPTLHQHFRKAHASLVSGLIEGTAVSG